MSAILSNLYKNNYLCMIKRLVMIIDTINQYLASNRRLVVPEFGVFIAKEDGCVVFSELLVKDDGVLRSLLSQQGLSWRLNALLTALFLRCVTDLIVRVSTRLRVLEHLL